MQGLASLCERALSVHTHKSQDIETWNFASVAELFVVTLKHSDCSN